MEYSMTGAIVLNIFLCLMYIMYYSIVTNSWVVREGCTEKVRISSQLMSLKNRTVLGRFKFCLSFKRQYCYFADVLTGTQCAGYLNFK